MPARSFLASLLYFDEGRDVLPVALLEGHLHLVALAEILDGHTVGHGHAHPVVEHQGPVRRVDRLDLAFHFSSPGADHRSEEHTSELQSLTNLVCRLLLEKKNIKTNLERPM